MRSSRGDFDESLHVQLEFQLPQHPRQQQAAEDDHMTVHVILGRNPFTVEADILTLQVQQEITDRLDFLALQEMTIRILCA